MQKNGTKTTLVFFLVEGEASWSLILSSVFLLSGSTVQPEKIYSCILKVILKAKKGKASLLITATTSVHLPKPVSTDLTIKPDSVLTNPIGKNGVQSWSM